MKSALTGKKGINLVKKECFDIVFLDIVMPGISANEVLEKIKESSLKTKVIMITGKLLDEDLLKELKPNFMAHRTGHKVDTNRNCSF